MADLLANQSNALITLAQQQFDQLTEADKKFFRAVARGEDADFRDGNAELDKIEQSYKWGNHRLLKADRIVWILTNQDAREYITYRGMTIEGALIQGDIDLSWARVSQPLFIIDSSADSIILYHSELNDISLQGSRFTSIRGDNVKVQGDFDLGNGFISLGHIYLNQCAISNDLICTKSQFNAKDGISIRLERAKIGGSILLNDAIVDGSTFLTASTVGGQIACENSHFKSSGDYAIVGDGVNVAHDIILSGSFIAEREVRFLGASINGDFNCANGHFKCKEKALALSNANIKGNVFLSGSFIAEGQVNLHQTKVDGQISCNSGKFKGNLDYALSLENSNIKGQVFLGNGFAAEGLVKLLGASIGGNLECSSGYFKETGGTSISAYKMRVSGHIILGEGFIAEGSVNLDGADIDGDLRFNHSQFKAGEISLSIANTNIKGDVLLNYSRFGAELILRGAVIKGNLECRESKFYSNSRNAILASNSQIIGNVFFSQGFNSEGEIYLCGANIGGNLNFSNGYVIVREGDAIIADSIQVLGSILFEEAKIIGTIRFPLANIGGQIVFRGSHLSPQSDIALILDGSVIKDDIFLNDKFISEGTILLQKTNIYGDLRCVNSHFRPKNGISVTTSKSTIGGDLDISQVRSEGLIKLTETKITGCLICSGAKFESIEVVSLMADSVKVGQHVFLDDGFTANGEVIFSGASVGANMSCQNARFNPKGITALELTKIQIAGSLILSNSFIAEGMVLLPQAYIGNQLICRGGKFRAKEGYALAADGTKIMSSVYLDGEFFSENEVRFSGATIEGSLLCGGEYNPKEGYAFAAEHMKIKGSIHFDPTFSAHGVVSLVNAKIDDALRLHNKISEKFSLDLRFAKVRVLDDLKGSWPSQNNLNLNGFEYQIFTDGSPMTSQSRLRWLRNQYPANFSLQPYNQLAQVLKNTGHEAEAVKVLIAKERDRRKYSGLGLLPRSLNYFLDMTIGYGYRSHRAFWTSLAIMLLGGYIFDQGWKQNLIRSANIQTKDAVSFNPWVYSVDTFLPVIDLKESNNWNPKVDKNQKITLCIFKTSFCMQGNGDLVRYYFWSHILLGWVFTSLWVAGFTGLIRRS
jgi:hypothetical protein